MKAADVIAALAARGYRVDARRSRVWAKREICHEASMTNQASIIVEDANVTWKAYCYACGVKVSKEIANLIGGGYAGGRRQGIGQAYDGGLNTRAGMMAYLRERYNAPAPAAEPPADTIARPDNAPAPTCYVCGAAAGLDGKRDGIGRAWCADWQVCGDAAYESIMDILGVAI